MKLLQREQKDILSKNIPLLNWEFETISNSSFKGLKNVIQLRNVINELDKIELLKSITSAIYFSPLFSTSKDYISVDYTESNKINALLSKLKDYSDILLFVLNQTFPKEETNSVNIKLPEIKDLDELSKISRDLHIAITQVVYNEEINGVTRIDSVENGSIWFNIFLGTTAAVSIIGSIAWSAAVVFKKIQEGRMLKEQVRSLKINNDSLAEIEKAQKKELDLVIDAETNYINSEYFKEGIPENLEKIKNSIKIFSELIQKGAEIKPALHAPENISNLFPEPMKLLGVESKIKKISNE
ncbi:hypothetical protein [Sphingobacterium mizutaii]|uniref:hypothetical protein n=1 Tax=Sphingobacterium mizutaii TaxID=1010 RepID=UPI0016242BEA|nr:hypothetical protein [Sphingobacterium mizutaii]